MPLFSQPTTLLVITRDRVIRAEFRSPRAVAPASIAVRNRPESDDPLTAVTAALGADRRSPGRVFVLSTDLWTRTLSVPSLNLRSLSNEELRQSLAFEAEPLSGLSPAEADTAAVPLGDEQGSAIVWITQTSSTAAAEIDDVVRGAGGKLAGVLHPAALPASILEDASVGSVSRVEFWPDAAVRVVVEGGRVVSARIDAAAKIDNRSAVVDEWSRQSAASSTVEVLVPEFRPTIEPAWISWEDEAALGRWLAGWNRVLSARQPAVPLLRPAKRPLSRQQQSRIATVLALLAAMACVGHYYWVRRETEAAAAEQVRLEAPGKEAATLNQRQTEADKTLAKLRDELTKRTDDIGLAEDTLDAHRRRLGKLLERLSLESTHEWVLQKIDGSARELNLVGVTMHPEHISVLAAEMADDLAQYGWSVEPPEHQARRLLKDGGPWTFELHLHDQTLPARPVVPTPTNVVRTPGSLIP